MSITHSYSVLLIHCTHVLIASPLCAAGDEKLVLLLPPDSPSPPDYSVLSLCVRVYAPSSPVVQSTFFAMTAGKDGMKFKIGLYSVFCHFECSPDCERA